MTGEWRPISEAKKDGTPIWAVIRADLVEYTGREDLDRWAGLQLPLRCLPELAKWGWNVAAPVGAGGFPDDWIAGWMPLPAPPPPAGER